MHWLKMKNPIFRAYQNHASLFLKEAAEWTVFSLYELG